MDELRFNVVMVPYTCDFIVIFVIT